MQIDIEFYDDNDEEYTISFPAKYEICDRCKGKGTHVNPNIDGHGITASEWENDWDFEERENYMNGFYDVQCDNKCDYGKIIVIDYDILSDDMKKKADEYYKRERDLAAERAYEARMRNAENGWY